MHWMNNDRCSLCSKSHVEKLLNSIHYGSIAVVDAKGKLISSYGDPQAVAFLRSSAKPFQALPFVERGGVEHFGFTRRELVDSLRLP